LHSLPYKVASKIAFMAFPGLLQQSLCPRSNLVFLNRRRLSRLSQEFLHQVLGITGANRMFDSTA